MGRYLRYNNSVWDGHSEGVGESESKAIATDKHPLLAGQSAQFVNYSNTDSGLTGLVVDIKDLPAGQTLTTADFSFAAGSDNTSATWPAAPAPSDITVQRAGGVDGVDRVFITWPANTIVNEWLKVTIKATASTGLSSPDTFYFGHLRGEAGDSGIEAAVTSADYAAVYDHRSDVAEVNSAYDINRDGRVSFIDAYIAWRQTRAATSPTLLLITP